MNDEVCDTTNEPDQHEEHHRRFLQRLPTPLLRRLRRSGPRQHKEAGILGSLRMGVPEKATRYTPPFPWLCRTVPVRGLSLLVSHVARLLRDHWSVKLRMVIMHGHVQLLGMQVASPSGGGGYCISEHEPVARTWARNSCCGLEGCTARMERIPDRSISAPRAGPTMISTLVSVSLRLRRSRGRR